jgi:hypothetical protein
MGRTEWVGVADVLFIIGLAVAVPLLGLLLLTMLVPNLRIWPTRGGAGRATCSGHCSVVSMYSAS